MYGKLTHDLHADLLLCEFPVKGKDGRIEICGKWCKSLSQHIVRHHKITTREYKKLLGLNLTLPLVSRDMQEKWREANKKYKLYANLKKGKAYRLKKGRTTIQHYKRSEQTKKRLRTLRQVAKKGKL